MTGCSKVSDLRQVGEATVSTASLPPSPEPTMTAAGVYLRSNAVPSGTSVPPEDAPVERRLRIIPTCLRLNSLHLIEPDPICRSEFNQRT